MPRGGPKSEQFKLGGFWIGKESDSPGSNYYRYWYPNDGRRKVKRASLGTADWEAAKQALAQFVQLEHSEGPSAPEDICLTIVLEKYFLSVTDRKPSAEQARISGAHMLKFFGAEARLSDVSPRIQREFMHYSSKKLKHSVSTIARTLSVLNAAKNFAIRNEIATLAPAILCDPSYVAETLDQDRPEPREWIPSIKQMGELFDWVCSKPRREHQFWFLIGMLNTGARPAAVLELGRNQVEWDHQLVHLNPPGRRQQPRKLRPSIRISNCLWEWMHYRDDWERWVGYGRDNRPIANMKNMAKRVRAELGWEEYCTYSIRHFVSTHLYGRMRANGVADAKQQLAYVLGHSGELNSTTDRYIKYSPDFMSAPIDAVDDLMKDIQEHTKYELFAPKTHPKP